MCKKRHRRAAEFKTTEQALLFDAMLDTYGLNFSELTGAILGSWLLSEAKKLSGNHFDTLLDIEMSRNHG